MVRIYQAQNSSGAGPSPAGQTKTGDRHMDNEDEIRNLFAMTERSVRPSRPDAFAAAQRARRKPRLKMELTDEKAAAPATPAQTSEPEYLGTFIPTETLKEMPRAPRPVHAYNDLKRIIAALQSSPDILPEPKRKSATTGRSKDEYDNRHGSFATRLTVYTVNLTLMIVAFPVGFGVLIYNILGGENLRVTARAMAITGTVIGVLASGAMDALI